jgi:hypothetical protein
LAIVGREPSDTAAVRGDGMADRSVVATGGLNSGGCREETQRRL